MFDSALAGMLVFVIVFLVTWSLGFAIFLRSYGDKRRALARIRDLSAEKTNSADTSTPKKWNASKLPAIPSLFLPKEEERLAQIRALFVQAGIYHAHAPALFVGAKWLLMLILPAIALGFLFVMGRYSLKTVSIVALSACALGMWAPRIWLQDRIAKRQRMLRSAFPDALDMLVLCMEGGVSLMAALQRVTDELQS
ncbi:MAG TPA: hypothetical protein VE988_27640, partial [Gemmataceae bacterium]|nr:hypothetical protein [Gemmataceae bacterium]